MYKLLQLLANEENVTLCSGVELTYLIHIPNQDLLIHSLPCHPCKSTNWFRDITTPFKKVKICKIYARNIWLVNHIKKQDKKKLNLSKSESNITYSAAFALSPVL